MITADQLLAHAVGDYILQTDWMANQKTKRTIAAFLHALTYSAVFLLLRPSLLALAVIFGSHLVIDRFRLARFVCFAKNYAGVISWNWVVWPLHFSPNKRAYVEPDLATGYPTGTPPFLAVWLLIIADNVLHVLINGAALRWL
jgi:hypothetical protein